MESGDVTKCCLQRVKKFWYTSSQEPRLTKRCMLAAEGKAYLHSTDLLLTPPSTTGLKKARSWPGNGVYCSLMSPVYMESSFRRTFLNIQLSLMLLCRLLNKAPTANNVGAESRRCSSLKRWKNSLRSWCDREEWNIRKVSLYCDLGLLSFWWQMQEFQLGSEKLQGDGSVKCKLRSES